MGGNTSEARLLEMAEFFGEGSEVIRVEGAMPSDLSEVAARFYTAQEAQVRDDVEAMFHMTEKERLEMLEVIENPDVRAMFDGSVPVADDDAWESPSESGFFSPVHLT